MQIAIYETLRPKENRSNITHDINEKTLTLIEAKKKNKQSG